VDWGPVLYKYVHLSGEGAVLSSAIRKGKGFGLCLSAIPEQNLQMLGRIIHRKKRAMKRLWSYHADDVRSAGAVRARNERPIERDMAISYRREGTATFGKSLFARTIEAGRGRTFGAINSARVTSFGQCATSPSTSTAQGLPEKASIASAA